MKKYVVCIMYDASKAFSVSADTPEEAEIKALDQVGPIDLCHECSDHIDIGDPMRVVDVFEVAD